MRVIGIDPGLARTGYGIVERRDGGAHLLAAGTLRGDKTRSAAEQLRALGATLTALMQRHRPDAAAVERLFVNANRRTATRVGQASGVALAAAAAAGVPTFEYTPSEVKRAIVGVGRADKGQVMFMVRAILRLAEAPDSPDAADALALAICHLNGERLRAAGERAR